MLCFQENFPKSYANDIPKQNRGDFRADIAKLKNYSPL